MLKQVHDFNGARNVLPLPERGRVGVGAKSVPQN